MSITDRLASVAVVFAALLLMVNSTFAAPGSEVAADAESEESAPADAPACAGCPIAETKLAPPPGHEAADEAAAADADAAAPESEVAAADADKAKAAPAGNLVVNREQRYVEFDAKIVFQEGEWVELIACSPNTLEYESLTVTEARPSQIHLGLIMVGLEPGSR